MLRTVSCKIVCDCWEVSLPGRMEAHRCEASSPRLAAMSRPARARCSLREPRACEPPAARAASGCPRHVQPHRSRRVRRACPSRAHGHRRDRAQAHPGHARRPHRPRGADRPAGPRRPLQPRDRRPAVHQSADGPVPPGQGLRQARRHLAQPARPPSPQPSQPGVADADWRLATGDSADASASRLRDPRSMTHDPAVGRLSWTRWGWTASRSPESPRSKPSDATQAGAQVGSKAGTCGRRLIGKEP
jgi:hypothetical protein